MKIYHQWLHALEDPSQVVRIFLLDFVKAFDRVDHKILMQKLSDSGLPDFIIRWIGNFLLDRKQRVKIGSDLSSWKDVKAGVPQGTLLGPPCFLLHINDLSTCVNDIKYVDDSNFWESCKWDGSDSRLQESADQASLWIDDNHMGANIEKTHEAAIYFGRRNLQLEPLKIAGKEIDRVSLFKLLGVHFNDKLTWHDHVEYMCSKASRRLYFLYLLKKAGRPPMDILDVYTSVVRSVLEYAVELWHPGLTKQQSDEIEHIQHRALNIIYPDLKSTDATNVSGLESLCDRRESRCRTLFQQMCNSSHSLHHLLPAPRVSEKTRSKMLYSLPKVRTNRFKNSPINYCLFNYQER